MLPFAMINLMKFDDKAYKLFKNVLTICIFIAVVYGIFLTSMPGVNPWLIILLPLNGDQFNNSYALAESGGRVFGRISSVYSDTQAFGLVLTLAFVYVYALINPKSKNNLYFILLGLIVIAVFVCGIRTPIVAVMFSVIYFLLLERKTKLFVYTLIAFGLIYFVIINSPQLDVYFKSIYDKSSSSVGGSTTDLRLEQLNGCFNIIKGNELTGQGYGWTANYLMTKGGHPVVLAFESLLYVVLCNSGFIGIIIWIITIIMYYSYTTTYFNKSSQNLIKTLIFAYLCFTLLTGDYGYMKNFLIFYVLIIEGQKKVKYFSIK